MNKSGLFLVRAYTLIVLICTKLYCLQLLPAFVNWLHMDANKNFQASLVIWIYTNSGISTHNKWKGSQVSTQSSPPPRTTKGANIPSSHRVSETCSGSNSQDCQKPQFSRLSPKLLRAGTTERGSRQAAKSRNLALLQQPSVALIQRGHHHPSRTQHLEYFSTSCPWAARRSTGFGESPSRNMGGIRTRHPGSW